jgi:hypothetical protein
VICNAIMHSYHKGWDMHQNRFKSRGIESNVLAYSTTLALFSSQAVNAKKP